MTTPRQPTALDGFLHGPLWGATRFNYQHSPALLARLTPERRKILQPVAPLRPPTA